MDRGAGPMNVRPTCSGKRVAPYVRGAEHFDNHLALAYSGSGCSKGQCSVIFCQCIGLPSKPRSVPLTQLKVVGAWQKSKPVGKTLHGQSLKILLTAAFGTLRRDSAASGKYVGNASPRLTLRAPRT
jgi:hypothetical protein